ncbi:MAG: T9SS type A sorting domain-containing protein [Bacteroidales bacterium]|nr:T9SS type A sorting domain-containing protein [Bacteroidales bacterium]
MKKLFLFIAAAFLFTNGFSQVITTDQAEIEYYVNEVLLGNLVSASNITFTGSIGGENSTIGEFNNYEGTILELNSGIVISNGYVSSIVNSSGVTISASLNGVSDPDLDVLASANTYDATIIEFDYVPYTNAVRFQYVFASEEFPEYVYQFNDAFGFFVSGPGISGPYSNQAINIAKLPDTDENVCINSVYNTEYYIQNTSDEYFAFDGLIKPLDAVVSLIPFETYHMKIIIGDAADHFNDTGVFLKSNSFESMPIVFDVNSSGGTKDEANIAIEDSTFVTVSVTLPEPAINDISYPFVIGGTAENGVDYEIIEEVVFFAQGEQSSQIHIIPDCDLVEEGIETIELFFEYIDETIEIEIVDNANCDLYENIEENYSEFRIYPNPAQNILNIYSNSQIQLITIYNASGTIAKSIKGHQTGIDISDLTKGVYYVKISGKGTTSTNLLIIN